MVCSIETLIATALLGVGTQSRSLGAISIIRIHEPVMCVSTVDWLIQVELLMSSK